MTDTYDSLNRRVRRQVGVDGPTCTFGYDAGNRLTSLADTAGVELRTYDAMDRLTGTSRGDQAFTYAYDVDGNLAGRTWPDGTRITASYDRASRLTGLTTVGGVAGAAPASFGFGYDPSGRLVATTYPQSTGLVTDRAYDRAGRRGRRTLAGSSSARTDGGRQPSSPPRAVGTVARAAAIDTSRFAGGRPQHQAGPPMAADGARSSPAQRTPGGAAARPEHALGGHPMAAYQRLRLLTSSA